MKLAFAAQMKEMDRVAIEERGIPSLDLMERAAEEIADVVEELTEVQESSAGREKRLLLPEATGEVSIGDCCRTWTKMPGKGEKRVAVFVGPGNNGGDGVAAARLLKERGWDAAVFLVGDRGTLTPDTAAMERRLAEVGLTLRPFPADTTGLCELYAWCAGCDAFVDALFGVGLCREVSGLFALVIALMNTYDNIPTVSADIASGLHADTGKVLGCAVRAAATVTFSLAKPGQFIDQGALYTGRLMVRDIGIPGDVMAAQALNVETIDAAVVKEMLAFIRQHYRETLVLQDVVDALNYSETFLNKKFKKQMGTTFIEYLNRFRIQKALELLREGRTAVQDVSWQCGIGDYKYFNMVFKKYIGCSPKEYVGKIKQQEK